MSKKWKKFGSVASKTRQPTAREKPASRIERLAKSQFDIEYYREQYQITGLDTDVDYYSHYLDSGDKANFCPYRGFNPLIFVMFKIIGIIRKRRWKSCWMGV